PTPSSISKFRSAPTATPTTGTWSAWKKCASRCASSSKPSTVSPKARSWAKCPRGSSRRWAKSIIRSKRRKASSHSSSSATPRRNPTACACARHRSSICRRSTLWCASCLSLTWSPSSARLTSCSERWTADAQSHHLFSRQQGVARRSGEPVLGADLCAHHFRGSSGGCVGHELERAQGAGALSGSPRPHARGPARMAAALRRRAQADAQGRHHSRRSRPVRFLGRAADRTAHGVHGLYRDSVWPFAGGERHEYRHPVYARCLVAWRARHRGRGMGLELALSVDRRAAVECADGVL